MTRDITTFHAIVLLLLTRNITAFYVIVLLLAPTILLTRAVNFFYFKHFGDG